MTHQRPRAAALANAQEWVMAEVRSSGRPNPTPVSAFTTLAYPVMTRAQMRERLASLPG